MGKLIRGLREHLHCAAQWRRSGADRYYRTFQTSFKQIALQGKAEAGFFGLEEAKVVICSGEDTVDDFGRYIFAV